VKRDGGKTTQATGDDSEGEKNVGVAPAGHLLILGARVVGAERTQIPRPASPTRETASIELQRISAIRGRERPGKVRWQGDDEPFGALVQRAGTLYVRRRRHIAGVGVDDDVRRQLAEAHRVRQMNPVVSTESEVRDDEIEHRVVKPDARVVEALGDVHVGIVLRRRG